MNQVRPHQFTVSRPGLLKWVRVSACEGWLACLGQRRVWAGGMIGEVCELIGTGSGQGRVRPVDHVTRRGMRPRITRRMAWSGQAVGR